MTDLRFLTAGESHGKALVAVLEGVPAGLPLTEDYIARDLRRRQGGYGRSKRQQLEQDHAEIVGGVRHGLTLGGPIAMLIQNRVWEDWQEVMQVGPYAGEPKKVTRLRPGHADLAGSMKYGFDDARNVLERASARETAARVAVGAICRRFLEEFGIEVHSHTVSIGDIRAQAVMSIHAVKGVEIGGGFAVAAGPGSEAHDVILPPQQWEGRPWRRASNRAGGLEGGMTNGEPVIVRGALKPISTLSNPLPSV